MPTSSANRAPIPKVRWSSRADGFGVLELRLNLNPYAWRLLAAEVEDRIARKLPSSSFAPKISASVEWDAAQGPVLVLTGADNAHALAEANQTALLEAVVYAAMDCRAQEAREVGAEQLAELVDLFGPALLGDRAEQALIDAVASPA